MNAECPNCHSPVTRPNRFCNQCGHDLGDLMASPEKTPPAASPRTVLLSELPAQSNVATPPAPRITETALAEAIIASGLVTRAEMEAVRQAGTPRLYRALVEAAPIREASLRDLMSRSFQIPIIDLTRAQTAESVINRFPVNLLRQHEIWPLAESAGQWTLAVADPSDAETISAIEKALNRKVELRLASASEIRQRLAEHFSPRLVGVLSSGEKIEFALTQKETEIGKADHNKLRLNDPTVSNTHAIILQQDSGYSIVDLGSRNGTFVNDQKLAGEAVTLKHGDKLTLGRAVLTYRRADETPQSATVRLDPNALAELSKRYAINTAVVTAPPQAAVAAEEKSEKKKKKDKTKEPKKEEDRVMLALINSGSRLIATILGVALTAAATFFGIKLMGPNSDKGKSNPPVNVPPPATAKFQSPDASREIKGGIFEASGVAAVSGSNAALFIDDSKPGKAMLMNLDASGRQSGALESIALRVKVDNPEAITFSGTHYYVISSQADPAAGDKNALVRFIYDAASRNVSGQSEVVPDFRNFLLSNSPELKGIGEKPSIQGGLNVEGLAWDPKNKRLLLGLRGPVPERQALLIPVRLKNPDGALTQDNLQIEPAIRLSLGGQAVRDLAFDPKLDAFLIISGAPETEQKGDFRLWTWSGDPSASPQEDVMLDRRIKPEGITPAMLHGKPVVLIVGDANSYLTLNYANQ
jgi:pSer/pThr/pTyr-binding forkhead associated (FHA) protein